MDVMLVRRIGQLFVRMSRGSKVVVVCVLVLLVAGTALLVYATGGIRFAYSHLMYVPIVLAGIAFGLPGGLVTAVVGGLVLGPLMPIDTATGEMQEPMNWVYRIVFFAFVGALV